MQDNFKSYIDQHQEAFEFPFDAEKGWADFESRRPKPKVRTNMWMMAAAVSAVVLVSGYLVFFPATVRPELTEWQEAELFYQQQISQMTQMVKTAGGDEQILYDLEEMDQAFAELKADLKDQADNAEVIAAMMDHYRLKLQILERMLKEIKDENEEPKDISIL